MATPPVTTHKKHRLIRQTISTQDIRKATKLARIHKQDHWVHTFITCLKERTKSRHEMLYLVSNLKTRFNQEIKDRIQDD